MDVKRVKQLLAEFAKNEFGKQKMTWEEAEEIGAEIQAIPDDLQGQMLLDRVKALDDNNSKLTPIVMKLMGEWGTEK